MSYIALDRPPATELAVRFQDQRRGPAFEVTVTSSDGGAALLPWQQPVESWELEAARELLAADGMVVRGSTSESRDPIRDIGARLFGSVFTGRGAALYRRAAESPAGVRVRIHGDHPAVTAMPWEMMFDPDRRDFLVLMPDSSVVRQECAQRSRDLPPAAAPLKVLVVASEPPGTRVDVHRDVAAIRHLAERFPGLLEIEVLEGRGASDIRSWLQRPGREYDVLHFAGSGFEGQDGKQRLATSTPGELLSGEQLAASVAQQPHLRVGLLSACHSDRVAAELAAAVPCVVGIRGVVTVEGCMAFLAGFYEALLDGQPADAASWAGRRTSDERLPGRREWCAVVMHLSGEGRLLDGEPHRSTKTAPSRSSPPAYDLSHAAPADTVALRLRRSVVSRNLDALAFQAQTFGEATPPLVRQQIEALERELAELDRRGGSAVS